MNFRSFRKTIWDHYRRAGRDLPWRPPSLKLRKDKILDPYKVLVSEVMLQQTQVDRVSGYYGAFLKRFPTLRTLAEAEKREVLAAWQGLGYNRRALYLKRTAEIAMREHGGRLPQKLDKLIALPGVGGATAGALLAYAWNRPVPFIETNIRRVFIHFFFPRRRNVRDAEVLNLVAATLDRRRPREWYWALMDYGSVLGRNKENPNRRSAHYMRQPRFEGSNRELRGKALRVLTRRSPLTLAALAHALASPPEALRQLLRALQKEGFVRVAKGVVRIA